MSSQSFWDAMDDFIRRAKAPETEADEPEARCTECERPIGTDGRWYSDGVGGLAPYCRSCATLEFPLI